MDNSSALLKPRAAVIVAVYQNIPFLRLVLQGLARQRVRDFEVIIAEDCDSPAMRAFLDQEAGQLPFVLKHVSQADDGFRKAAILNKAILAAAADYLIFIDGDCIPHPDFVGQHLRAAAPGIAVYGRRVMLSERLTDKLLKTRDLSLLHFFSLWRYGCERLDAALFLPFIPAKHGRKTGIWGCNWSIRKQHLLDINGFDEDYVTPGIGEDTDPEWRLQAMGVVLRHKKFSLIQYHLWHKAHYSDTAANEALMQQKKAENAWFCDNGIEKRR